MSDKTIYKMMKSIKSAADAFSRVYFGFIFCIFPFAKKFLIKTPVIKENTFIIWEPCSKSHSEVVPGFVKYFCDLGYHVSVVVEPKHIQEGLFSRFNLKNVDYNKLSSVDIKKFFLYGDLSKIKGVLITTAGKLCGFDSYDNCYKCFNSTIDKSRLFFVEHDIKDKVDSDNHNENIITLRKMDYKNTKTVVVNPHYFGDIKITEKSKDTVIFLTVGAIRAKRKNNNTIIEAVNKLHKKGITNFKVVVIGKGQIKEIPAEIQKYFDIKGRLPFDKMYDEIEKSDFLLTSYDKDNIYHLRYITTGTSGNFQLVYGFLKPCLIVDKFAPINAFDETNSIVYKDSNVYADAMESALKMSRENYLAMQDSLKHTVLNIEQESKQNLENLVK